MRLRLRTVFLAAAAALLLLQAICLPHTAQADAPPAYTVTRYVTHPEPARFYWLGCSAGTSAQSQGPANGIVILDFGMPSLDSSGYGTIDFGAHFDSLATISAVSQSWMHGFYDCTRWGATAPQVKLGIGTSNYHGTTNFAHGEAWAGLVNNLNTWVVQQGMGRQIAVRGASDLEIGWNTAAHTRDWVDGYNAIGIYQLYDYGDAEAGINPPYGWTPEDVWYKAYGARLNWPIPEIYYAANATLDWQPLSLWAYTHKGAAISFSGVMTQYASDHTSLPPLGGWSALYLALNSDGRTAQSVLPNLTDITWAN